MYSDFRDQNRNPVAASVVLEAIKRPIIKQSVIIQILASAIGSPRLTATESDIIRGSLTITNSCASDGIKLGSVNIGMAKVTIKNERFANFESPSEVVGCFIRPMFYIEIDENTTVLASGGSYWIKEVEQLTEGVRLTCYDGMSKLDEPFTLGTITGTPYQILTQAATACDVAVQSTQAEIEALPNGTRTFTLHSDNDCKTWRDVLSYLSMLMGCFVTIGNIAPYVQGAPGLVIRPFGNGKESFCDTVTDVHRYKGAKFSIFDTEYKAIELTAYAVDGEDTIKKDFTYAETTGVTGQTIKLGYNPFIQADTPEADLTQTQRDILHELLTQVDKYAYTPMQISLPVGFIYDLGDVIKCTGGLANTGFAGGYTEDCYCCISNYTYTYGKEFRIKTLESKAAKARSIVIPFSATLNVTVVNGTGATITATDGTNTYTATESGGSASLTILAAGTYTVTATLNGETGSKTATVVIDASGTYTAEVGFISGIPIDSLPSGTLIKDVNTRYLGDVIIWRVIGKNHPGDPANSVTLMARDILSLKCFDSVEPTNPLDARKWYGNNRYLHSNLLQWLNSDEVSWFSPQHNYDAAPTLTNIRSGSGLNHYDTEAGFLTNFSTNFKAILQTATKLTVKDNNDGGGSENVSSKIFLLSTTEIGMPNVNGIAEGSIYEYFDVDDGGQVRIKNFANEAAKGSYTTLTNPYKWRLRTPSPQYGTGVMVTQRTGGTSPAEDHAAEYRVGVSPALCIPSTTIVSDTPDTDGAYIIQF